MALAWWWRRGGACDADGVDADVVDTVGMAADGSLVFPVSVAT